MSAHVLYKDVITVILGYSLLRDVANACCVSHLWQSASKRIKLRKIAIRESKLVPRGMLKHVTYVISPKYVDIIVNTPRLMKLVINNAELNLNNIQTIVSYFNGKYLNLSKNNISSGGISLLAQSRAKYLDLSWTKIRPHDMQVLSSFKGNHLDIHGSIPFYHSTHDYLPNFKGRRLIIGGFEMNMRIMQVIIKMKLKYLEISYAYNFTNEFSQMFATINCQCLNLTNCYIDDSNAIVLSAFKGKKLILSRNSIGDVGAEALSAFTGQYLILDHNKIENTGAKHLAAFKGRYLDISHNYIEDLETLSTFKGCHLNVSHNYINNNGIRKIAIFQGSYLNISYNRIEPEGVISLANFTGQSLCVEGNYISCDGMSYLAQNFKGNYLTIGCDLCCLDIECIKSLISFSGKHLHIRCGGILNGAERLLTLYKGKILHLCMDTITAKQVKLLSAFAGKQLILNSTKMFQRNESKSSDPDKLRYETAHLHEMKPLYTKSQISRAFQNKLIWKTGNIKPPMYFRDDEFY